MKKERLDDFLTRRGLAKDQKEAFIAVTSGRVFVSGQKAVSPAQPVRTGDQVELRVGDRFVGRGAHKLEAAIQRFGVPVAGAACADIGSATGGFVEILLKHGAEKVYAIDVGRGKLDLKLREDPHVVVMEETNVLSMAPLPEKVGVITIDVSFTSLRLVLPKVRPWLSGEGKVIALFKPQYEVDKRILKHGIVEDERLRAETLAEFRTWLRGHDWQELGSMESPIRGSEGNVEYLFYLQPGEV